LYASAAKSKITKAFAINEDGKSQQLPSASPPREKFKILGTESMTSSRSGSVLLYLIISCTLVLFGSCARIQTKDKIQFSETAVALPKQFGTLTVTFRIKN
jgi:hypothetical protein